MKTDWKDDIFTRRKIRLESNDDGTVTPVDETEYTQQGDSFGALELNAMGEEINSLTAEVAATKKSVSDGKALVAAAITAKRVKTAATATFPEMAANIDKIVLGSGNAQPADVLAGKTATNDSGVEFTGTMPERGSKSITLPINGSQDLPAGHYSGVQIRQSIPTLGGTTVTPQTYAQTIAAAGKYGTGNHTIAAVPLPPANVIKKGYRYWIGSNYVDGTYVYSDITGYYYQAPNEMTGVTGGFVSRTETYGSMARPESVSYSKQTGYMEINVNVLSSDKSYSVYGHFITQNKIDVTKIRNIYLDIVHTGVTSYAGLATNASDIRNSIVVREAMSGTATVSLDVSMLTGQYYLFFTADGQYGVSSGSRGARTRVSAIRYETMA